MTNITVLGLGAMGSRMAIRLLEAGHNVTVWNRSPEPIQALAEKGALTAASPALAVAQADIAISMVRDDLASEAVWLDKDTGALKGLAKNAIAIESSTLTPAWIKHLSGHCNALGVNFADAPVAGSRPQAEAAKLIYFVGADLALFDTIKPMLSIMGGAVHHAGPVGAGAKIKLAVNALFGVQLATMGELLGYLAEAKVDLGMALDIIGSTPVCSPAAKISVEAMIAGKFAPAFPIDLVEKDFAYIEKAAAAVGVNVPQSSATRLVLQKAKASGFGDDNITGLVQLYLGG